MGVEYSNKRRSEGEDNLEGLSMFTGRQRRRTKNDVGSFVSCTLLVFTSRGRLSYGLLS